MLAYKRGEAASSWSSKCRNSIHRDHPEEVMCLQVVGQDDLMHQGRQVLSGPLRHTRLRHRRIHKDEFTAGLRLRSIQFILCHHSSIPE